MEYNSDKQPLDVYTQMLGMTAVISISIVVALIVWVFKTQSNTMIKCNLYSDNQNEKKKKLRRVYSEEP
ncbi:hypothetical protein BpHYR1_047078 [Brachionus plicatilis]|uniref:Uncharacterized protein n=1 Tax=Brachionus plicatilis TaxID=10195 RepID=A0A3M7QV06_BRAPC|nr:hypothetical protein BpHYR1_047078 [Brachionus plicatilis]